MGRDDQDGERVVSSAPVWRERALWIIGVYALFLGGYCTANRLVPLSACRDLSLPLDRTTPFVPELIYPFWLAYLLVPAPALLVPTRTDLMRAASAFAALILVSCTLFFLLPVTVPRPAAIPDTTAGTLLSLIYACDRPVCGFPSLHVSSSLLAAILGWRVRRSTGMILLVFWALTATSTLFVKQHVLADVAGGTVLGLLVALAAGLWPVASPRRGES